MWTVQDRVLARNVRPGPDWVPGTIVQVLGPVTYLVETDDGQRWKRHTDQLKVLLYQGLTLLKVWKMTTGG